MTKKDIAAQLAHRTGLTPHQALTAIDETISILADAMASGETIFLRGFGTLKTVTRAAKPARDIRRGTVIMMPQRRQVKFTAYPPMQARLDHPDNPDHPVDSESSD